ncbi:MAG: ABC transporter permease [Candidatus Melainabacteria bacterium]|jgi:oligopeptide transport system permease protein|nr:ABC transporter permease [Candidatus Melainabacteria bacterium]
MSALVKQSFLMNLPWRWLLNRLFNGGLTLVIVLSLTFILLRLMPGGPFDNPKLPESVKLALEARYHLNSPLWEQLVSYFQGLLRGDLGPSLVNEGRTVADLLKDSVPVSLALGLLAGVIGIPAGVGIGLWLGLTEGTKNWQAALVEGLLVLILASPSFLIAGGLVWLFAVKLAWLPVALLSTPAHWVLPVATLCSVPIVSCSFLVKKSVIETKNQLYVTLKYAYGLPNKLILLKHLLKPSLLPLVAVSAPLLANLLTGSFAVEYLFAIPGMGKQFIAAIINRDYTVVLGLTGLYALFLLVFNLISDGLLVLIDPRLKESTNQ